MNAKTKVKWEVVGTVDGETEVMATFDTLEKAEEYWACTPDKDAWDEYFLRHGKRRFFADWENGGWVEVK